MVSRQVWGLPRNCNGPRRSYVGLEPRVSRGQLEPRRQPLPFSVPELQHLDEPELQSWVPGRPVPRSMSSSQQDQESGGAGRLVDSGELMVDSEKAAEREKRTPRSG